MTAQDFPAPLSCVKIDDEFWYTRPFSLPALTNNDAIPKGCAIYLDPSRAWCHADIIGGSLQAAFSKQAQHGARGKAQESVATNAETPGVEQQPVAVEEAPTVAGQPLTKHRRTRSGQPESASK